MSTRRTRVLVAATSLILGVFVGSAGGESNMIAEGAQFVDFALPAHDGTVVDSRDLEGKPFLLFFYPKADTPG